VRAEFDALFGNFIKRPGATLEVARQACAALNLNPPPDFVAALQYANGGEGFVGQSYFHLYSTEEMLSYNAAYQVKQFAPGFIIFGSNGGGEAFGFDARHEPPEIVQIPFIPLDFELAERFGFGFIDFLRALGKIDANRDGPTPKINMDAFGKEVHEIHPIVFGGSPTDSANKALVPPEAHAELCVFWNKLYQEKVYGRNS
jgi:hypothetical protein